jgi:hypothetical protein
VIYRRARKERRESLRLRLRHCSGIAPAFRCRPQLGILPCQYNNELRKERITRSRPSHHPPFALGKCLFGMMGLPPLNALW